MAEADQGHAWCRQELRIQGDPEPALLRNLIESCSGNKKEHLRWLDLGADRFCAVALLLESLHFGAPDGKGRLGVGEDTSKPEPHALRVFALTILPGSDCCSGARSLSPLLERFPHVPSISSSSSRLRSDTTRVRQARGSGIPSTPCIRERTVRFERTA